MSRIMGSTLMRVCFRGNSGAGSSSSSSGSPFASLNWQDLSSSLHGEMRELATIDIISFNLLAPCYKRMETRTAVGRRHRESHNREVWMPRAEQALSFFRQEIIPAAGIIALQEFWMGDEGYKEMFMAEFERHGYSVTTLQRTGDKMDAVALLVKESQFEIMAHKNVNLCSVDRIALVLWLKHKETGKSLVVANTHLSFPHTSLDRILQMHQMRTLTSAMEAFERELLISSSTHVVVGDFNVEAQSPVCNHLRERGYVNGMDVSPPRSATPRPADEGEQERPVQGLGQGGASQEVAVLLKADSTVEARGCSKWISHRTHRVEDLGVDHVFVKPEIEWGGCADTPPTLPASSSAAASAATTPPLAPQTCSTKVDAGNKTLPVGGVFVGETSVLPRHLPCDSWPVEFEVSDHRPVRVSLILGRRLKIKL